MRVRFGMKERGLDTRSWCICDWGQMGHAPKSHGESDRIL